MTTLRTGAAGNDPTYDAVNTLMWTGVEMNIGIICACLPLLHPLLSKLLPWLVQRSAHATVARPTCVYDHGSGRARTNTAPNDDSWGRWGKGSNVIMSNISTRRPESRTSSEAGITEDNMIVKKFDVDTRVESADNLDLDKERQYSNASTSDSVV